ncbi:MAG: preprotein translocase subunit YajC [Desulfotomaculaceae bacterium]|nr:preprotein translocase subunit YajC [Desulfotomaculaceae bacterium]
MGFNSQYGSLLYIVAIFAILYFMMIRPQRQRQQKHEQMISNLKVEDRVVTVGGLYGTIIKIKDDYIILKVADNVRLKYQKNAVAQLTEEEPVTD